MRRSPSNTAIMFVANLIFSNSANSSEPNTAAFGGVATDNPKAREHAHVACVNVTEPVSVLA